MDPLGFGLEMYDGIGQYRATEKNRPVDGSGTVSGVATERKFTDARSLAQALVQTEEVQRCVATQWTRFALGRPESDDDAPSLGFVQARFRAGALDVKGLLQSIVA